MAAHAGKQVVGPAPHNPAVTQLIVKLRSAEMQGATLSTDTVASLSILGGRELRYFRRMTGGAHVLKLPQRMTLAAAEQIAAQLSAGAGVEYAVPDRIYNLEALPNDPRFGEQWNYMAPDVAPGGINLPLAWDTVTGDPGIVVAVLDTGLLPHADIDRNITDNIGRVAPGYDFISDPDNAGDGNGRDSNPSDPGDFSADSACGQNSSWHGTHVAGTIGALTDNGIGVAGINWSARIQPVRVMGKCGGVTSDIIDAMRWAAGLPIAGVPNNPTPARVLNLSVGGAGACNVAEQQAVNDVVAAGAVVVVAAGNSKADAKDFSPASCNNVITVGAHNRYGQATYYSNFGRTVEISAPGGDFQVDSGVLSTTDGGRTTPLNDNSYTSYQGTSMSAPHVAGVVSLLLSKNSSLSPLEILDIIQSTARPFPSYGNQSDCRVGICGAGIIDASGALASVPLPDNLPDRFSFITQTGVNPATQLTSNSATVSGITGAADISVSGGEYSINNGAFTATAGTVTNGQAIRLRQISSASFQTTSVATLTVGDLIETFSVTTRELSTTPNSFRFTDRSGVERSAVITSNAVSMSGLDALATIDIVGGEYSIGCTSTFVSDSGSIGNGQSVCVRHTAAPSFSSTNYTTLTVGGVADTFSSATRAPDTVPDAFRFTDADVIELSSEVTSNVITIAGIEIASPVSVSGGTWSINGGGFTSSPGSVNAGDSLRVRHTASSRFSTQISTVLTVGGVSDTFTSTTKAAPPAPDMIPDNFRFADQAGHEPAATVTSNIVSILGLNAPANISVAGGQYSIGCSSSFTAIAGTVGNGQTVCVRHTASPSFSSAEHTTLTIGGVSDTFSSTTRAPGVTPDSFSFIFQGNVSPRSILTSNTVIMAGLEAPATIGIAGGEYSIGCTTVFTSSGGSIGNGQGLCVRHTASANFASSTVTTLTLGGLVRAFTSETRAPDVTPDPFNLAETVDVQPAAVVTSSPVAITGLDVPVSIEVTGGEYSIGCTGTFTSSSNVVSNGQSVCVRHAASPNFQSTQGTTLIVNGISSTFKSTTRAAPPDGGSGGGGAFDWLAALVLGGLWARRTTCALCAGP